MKYLNRESAGELEEERGRIGGTLWWREVQKIHIGLVGIGKDYRGCLDTFYR